MSWSKQLVDTYDYCNKYVGVEKEGMMLLPIGHSTQNAQITVSLYEDGSYCSATLIENKEEAVTVIPVTEDSGSRSSGITPHPLHDKLMYVAGDLSQYQKKDNIEYYQKYLEQLNEWSAWEDAHFAVKIIYQYIKKGTLIHDLVENNVLKVIDNHFDEKVKIQGIPQSDAFVRFEIYSPNYTLKEPWKDKSLYDNYIQFYTKKLEENGLCYITGKNTPCTEKHPSKIRYSGDKAKIISSNDTSGFTFRGRVSTKEEALSIGYESSQKLHNALRWIIEKQGFQRNDMTIVAWNTKMPKVVNPAEDIFSSVIGMDVIEEEEEKINTKEDYAHKVKKAILGYRTKLDPQEEIMIMALDSATTGRLAITYYQELSSSDYYQNIENWYQVCSWGQYVKKGYMGCFGTPLPVDIINAAFGTLQAGGMKAKDDVIKSNMKRILPCIVEGKALSTDIVKAVYHKMIHMASVDEYQWQRLLGIFCALYRKEYYDKKGVLWEMSKQENEKNELESVDYLYGCLLAVMDAIEDWALRDQNGGSAPRATNEMLYFAAFQKNPCRTRKILENKLVPYIRRLGVKAKWLLDIKEDISYQLVQCSNKPEENNSKEDFSIMKRDLDGRFALGFDCQRKEIREEIKRRKEENEKKKQNVQSN